MATPGGYDYDFVEDPPKSLECPVCFLILREPLLNDCCGHHICRSCVTRIQQDRKPCPLCQAPNFSSMLNKGLQRTVNELKIRCPNRELGCEWKDKVADVESHLDPEERGRGCQFQAVVCAHNCGERFQQRFVAQHENVECPQRPFRCKYCGKYRGTYSEVTNNHWPECEQYPTPCPNKCELGTVPHNEFEKHLKENCPLQVVKCEFCYAGCEVEVQRKDMPDHMNTNLQQHLSLLAAFSLRLSVEVEQLKQQQANTATKGDIQTVKEEARQLTSHLESLFTPVPPFSFSVVGFENLKKARIPWFSPPFYTHSRGYKMCIEVVANGLSIGEDTHVSVNCRILRGEYDNNLEWPFQGRVHVQLLNHRGDYHHCERVISYCDRGDQDFGRRVETGDMNKGWGLAQFILHRDLHNPAQDTDYLPSNTLHFRVTKVELQ